MRFSGPTLPICPLRLVLASPLAGAEKRVDVPGYSFSDLLDVALLFRALDGKGPGLTELCAPAHALQ